MTQCGLSKSIGVSRSSVSKWISGDRKMPKIAEKLIEILEECDVCAEVLVEDVKNG